MSNPHRPLRLGIFMGGPSREREISYAGGRTVYDNLDRRLFAPVPLFVTGSGQVVQLHWQHLYKGTIRDFLPPPTPGTTAQPYLDQLGLTPEEEQAVLRQVGTPVALPDLPQLIDAAFLTLHGERGEDGALQGLLQWLGIPYTGTGLLGSALGIDKLRQRRLLAAHGFAMPAHGVLAVHEALAHPAAAAAQVQAQVGYPCVVKHPTQGSSIGVAVVQGPEDLAAAVARCAFQQRFTAPQWQALSAAERQQLLAQWCDLRQGLAFPMEIIMGDGDGPTPVAGPAQLQAALQHATHDFTLRSADAPHQLLVEAFIRGREFSVIVLRDHQGQPLALPPTEIRNPRPLFDYQAKYLPGLARKLTPMPLEAPLLQHLQAEAERLAALWDFGVGCRLDGILAEDGTLFFNDPNTTSGMLPGSFFFQQAAAVGLTPGALLTRLVRWSLQERAHTVATRTRAQQALAQLTALAQAQTAPDTSTSPERPTAVLMGGATAERHVSLESGRNVYEKLSATGRTVVPLFLLMHSQLPEPVRTRLGIPPQPDFSLWRMPPSLLLKDNADDVAAAICAHAVQPATEVPFSALRQRLEAHAPAAGWAAPWHQPAVFPEYVSWEMLAQTFGFAFLGLHGRPGEDGTVQRVLEQLGVPFNGSPSAAAALAMDKYATTEAWAAAGLRVARHALLTRPNWQAHGTEALEGWEYPLIAKPVDEGCSAAVKKLNTPAELAAYAQVAFREGGQPFPPDAAAALRLAPDEEFPALGRILIESYIQPPPGWRQLEVTVGVLETAPGSLVALTPSETLAAGEVLSLAEKFLAGEGQNLTPARLSADPAEQQRIEAVVRQQVARAAHVLGLRGYARLDAFVQLEPAPGTQVQVVFIEANTLPALTPATCLFHQAALEGFTPAQFLLGLMGGQREAL